LDIATARRGTGFRYRVVRAAGYVRRMRQDVRHPEIAATRMAVGDRTSRAALW
jgi:hypothetical protein